MHRLRDLDGRARLVALAVALCLAAPFVASVVKAVQVDWTPSNDDALITIRAHDVVAGEFPLIGQPSTAGQYADLDPPHHPGPIEFYLLVPPVQLLGSDVGVLVGAGLFNLTAVLVAAWVVFRRAGPAVGLLGAVVLSGLAWSQGLAVLTDPVSSNLGGIPLVALAVVGWAVFDGDVRLLPLWAFAFGFVAQQHLAIVGVSVGTAAWAGLGLVITLVGWYRARRAATTRADLDAVPRPLPWVIGAIVVSLIVWAPVLIDQFWGTGNIGRMIGFARSSERPSLGLWAGVRQGLRALGLPPLIVRTSLHGDEIHQQMSTLAVLGSLVVIGLLIAVVVVDRRRCRPRSSLAAMALAVATFGAITGSNVPDSMEADRLNFYRWAFVASALACIALVWAAADLLLRLRPLPTERLRGPAVATSLLTLVLLAASTIAWSGPQARRDVEVFAAERRLAAVGLAAVDGHKRVFVVPAGSSATLALAPSLALQLLEDGHDIGVPRSQKAGYGEHLLGSGRRFDAGLVIATGKDRAPDAPGRVIATIDLNRRNRAARARLAAQLKGQDLVVSPDGPAIIRQVAGDSDSLVSRSRLFKALLDTVATDPANALQFPEVVRAIDAGYFVDARFDQADLDTLLRHPYTSSWAEDIIQLRVLTADEVRAAYPKEVR